MLLGRLIADLPRIDTHGSLDVEIVDVAHDSREVTPGTLFVALPPVAGPPTAGIQEHVADAIRRGAVAVVSGVPVEGDVTQILVPDPRVALADLAGAFFGHPSRELKLFAVTGTDGKTTTSYLLEQILSAAGNRTGLIGTVEVKVGERREPNLERMTTPQSLELQRLLRAMVEQGVTHVAMEASSHALALDRLCGCSFAGCALTNITADHVEFHGSWEAYFAAKAKLFTELAPEAPAVLNRDDAHFDRWDSIVRGPRWTYSLERAAVLRATDLEAVPHGMAFTLAVGGESLRTSVPLVGAFNVSNALAAVGLACIAGVRLRVIADALAASTPPPGRMQRVDAGQEFDVIVDYAHTEHAFRSVLRSLRTRTGSGRLIAVFGATGDRDRAKRPRLAQVAREYADYFIITNEDPYGERPEEIIAEVASGVSETELGKRYDCELDREAAIRRAISRAQPGDTVVILGKGHEQSIVVAGRKEPWSDVAAVRRSLKAR